MQIAAEIEDRIDALRAAQPPEPFGLFIEGTDAATGWQYATEVEDYGDNRKLWHYAVRGDERVHFDWTPYARATSQEFALWIALGMPSRQTNGPLNANDLMHLAARRLTRAE